MKPNKNDAQIFFHDSSSGFVARDHLAISEARECDARREQVDSE